MCRYTGGPTITRGVTQGPHNALKVEVYPLVLLARRSTDPELRDFSISNGVGALRRPPE